MIIAILIIICVATSLLSVYLWQEVRVWRERARSAAGNDEHFKLMAREIFDRSSREFKNDSETRLAEILDPVKANLDDFRKLFTESLDKDLRDRTSLQAYMRQIVETSTMLGREAHGLANALRGNNRVQGRWGEMVLENLLEHCGLRRDEEFTLQTVTQGANVATGASMRLRPDAVINYPDGRRLAIDAKTSLSAYFNYVDAIENGDTAALNTSAKAHVASVRAHINELRDKSYQDNLDGASAGFVVMFIPHEGAFLAAIQIDKNLWDYAYESRVVIASPSHLMGVLKLVEQMWQNDRQNKYALAIAEQGGKMLDKLSAFLTDMDKIGNNLRSAQASLDGAMTKLQGKGGIISHGHRMLDLGAKATKTLPNPPESL